MKRNGIFLMINRLSCLKTGKQLSSTWFLQTASQLLSSMKS